MHRPSRRPGTDLARTTTRLLLGLPEEEWEQVAHWADDLGRSFGIAVAQDLPLIEAALEGLTGLAVCGQRHEEGSDISYLAAHSNLDETVYLAMVVAKPHGDEGVELELLCRASQGEAAQELLEELQSALRNRLLEAGGRLA